MNEKQKLKTRNLKFLSRSLIFIGKGNMIIYYVCFRLFSQLLLIQLFYFVLIEKNYFLIIKIQLFKSEKEYFFSFIEKFVTK